MGLALVHGEARNRLIQRALTLPHYTSQPRYTHAYRDNMCVGAVLSQRQLYKEKLTERVIAYASRKMTTAQANYSSFKVRMATTQGWR